MNKLRRKELSRIIEKLERLEALRLEIKDERHRAIKAFNDYQKTHAGIISVKNIEKGRWE